MSLPDLSKLMPPGLPRDSEAAHQQVTVRGIYWPGVLEFVYLFRAFRLAIHPAKLLMALLAIVLIYSAGRVFDAAWGPRVYKGEIEAYESKSAEAFARQRPRELDLRRADLQQSLDAHGVPAAEQESLVNEPRRAYWRLKRILEDEFHKAVRDAAETRATREKETQDLAQGTFGAPEASAEESPAELEQEDRRRAAAALETSIQTLKDQTGHGVFEAFLTYELKQFDLLVDNSVSFVRVSPLHGDARWDNASDTNDAAVQGALLSLNSARFWKSDTVAGCAGNMIVTAPMWLFSGTEPVQGDPKASRFQRWMVRIVYLASLILLAAFSLVVIAFCGGTISRLAATEFAGQSPISLKKALRFTQSRLPSFIQAPLVPFVIVLGVGLFLTILGLAGAIPFAGEVIAGLLFILFFAVGFIAMLMALGIIGGFNLMYPTIAAEGSDSFDAISRSFSYVYARPWRMLFYTLVALFYGVATYLFVAFAVFVLLFLTHAFVGFGMNLCGALHGVYSGLPKLDTLWPVPVFNNLGQTPNWAAMSGTEWLGSMFLYFWVFLIISLIGAYVLSYYFSSNTLIYFLLRRGVDGQSLSEIYDEAPGNAQTIGTPKAPEVEPTPLAGTGDSPAQP